VIDDHRRSGALEAVERIVNRGGDDVVAGTLAVLGRLYPSVTLRDDGTIVADGTNEPDTVLLRRVAVLISAHVR
jgi:hypothetical protein